MSYSIIINPPFKKEVKRLGKKYPSLKKDLQILQEELFKNPEAGVSLGNGIRKVRMAVGSKGRGKSHGARVITVTVIVNPEEREINLLYIYDKSERDTITANEIKALIEEVGL
ncbi:MAG TPA: addiction module toxin RelE [Porphyromonadaceae bacterium]|jgi:mRNA-degrading endonuclease RelE of RelBE toxin-antitoxin system|uniref:addiction module toxin RelE n=1 Tax=Limibacterium fermenti TaxID=3229863 RepID=UPI000E7EBD46|nr:addiction module toxin RelE [Porphyromonadaceae bacterium]HBL33391.1 addiction module toxin RelE [Porphyromonadaceae bacterium]HBX45023.1 addiction module toxin RelE [Porphyromonadaceae bacterium]